MDHENLKMFATFETSNRFVLNENRSRYRTRPVSRAHSTTDWFLYFTPAPKNTLPSRVLIECKSLTNYSYPGETLTIRAAVKSWRWAFKTCFTRHEPKPYTIRKLQQCNWSEVGLSLEGRGKLAFADLHFPSVAYACN